MSKFINRIGEKVFGKPTPFIEEPEEPTFNEMFNELDSFLSNNPKKVVIFLIIIAVIGIIINL